MNQISIPFSNSFLSSLLNLQSEKQSSRSQLNAEYNKQTRDGLTLGQNQSQPGRIDTRNVKSQTIKLANSTGTQNARSSNYLMMLSSKSDNEKRNDFDLKRASLKPRFRNTDAKRANNEIQGDPDTFMMVLHSSPNSCPRNQNDETLQIKMRSLQPKFIRELNFKQNQRQRKNRRKVQLDFNNQVAEIFNLNTSSGRKQKPYDRKHTHQIQHNGIKIVAQFKNDVLHGQARFVYPNGANFQGRYEQGVRIFGTFDFLNGYKYTGGFLGDKFNGEGQLTVSNGKVFSGDWSQNQLTGKTKVRYPSGDVYYGQIRDFKKHGKGYLFFKNGDKFIGQFQDGSITGKGQYFVEQKCIGRGLWKNGQLIRTIQNQDQLSSAPQSLNSISQKTDQKIKQKKPEQQDDLLMNAVEQDDFSIQMKTNIHMVGFQEVESRNKNKINKANQKRSAGKTALRSSGKDSSSHQQTYKQQELDLYEEQLSFCKDSSKGKISPQLLSQTKDQKRVQTNKVQEQKDQAISNIKPDIPIQKSKIKNYNKLLTQKRTASKSSNQHLESQIQQIYESSYNPSSIQDGKQDLLKNVLDEKRIFVEAYRQIQHADLLGLKRVTPGVDVKQLRFNFSKAQF